MRKEPVWLQPESVVAIHERLIAEFGGKPGLRDTSLLESALSRPRHLFHYRRAPLEELAAAYAFGLSSNHPFFDGNKRAALLAVGVFLARNGRTLTASEAEATVVMMRVAKGGMTEAEFAGWLKSNNARRRRS